MRLRLLLATVLILGGCDASSSNAPEVASIPTSACEPGNGGIDLPEDFCAVVVADVVAPRHMAVAPNGDLYISSRGRPDGATPEERGGIFALRDTTGDGRADVRAFFGPEGGTGILISDDHLYFATNTAVLRYRLDGNLQPQGEPETLVTGLPSAPGHATKSIALNDRGQLFVDIGSPGNACQPLDQDRVAGVPGEDPCSQLDSRAGVWSFDADEQGQTLAQGERVATGIRNAVAFALNPLDQTLYAVQHGREQLQIWPGFTPEDDDERVAEEFQRIEVGSDFGWPYCYFDLRQNGRVVAPEYGGNGREGARCSDAVGPIMTFPPHSAPNDLMFYTGAQFPVRFQGGAFIAFHGRGSPDEPGYRVAFVPFWRSAPTGAPETFASGFAGEELSNPTHRPMGLAQGPDGSLYIADSKLGRIWRVIHTGSPETVASR